MPLTLVLLAGAIALLVLIPTRRLFLAGLPSTVLAAYFLFMLGLGLLVAELRGPARFLIPIFVVAYIAPFVTERDGAVRTTVSARGERAWRVELRASPDGRWRYVDATALVP